MKYQYYITCQPPGYDERYYFSALMYSKPENALSAGVTRAMNNAVKYPGYIDEYVKKIEVLDSHGICVLRVGIDYLVNNL